SRENRFPGGNATTGCITPTLGCSGDLPYIQQLLMGQLAGFDPIRPWARWPCEFPYTQLWCDAASCNASQSEGGPCQWSPEPDDWSEIDIAGDPTLKNLSTCTS